MHATVRVKGKAGWSKDPWMMREIEAKRRHRSDIGSWGQAFCLSILKKIRRQNWIMKPLWQIRLRRIQRDFINILKENGN